jgi:coronin-1B/1C/6
VYDIDTNMLFLAGKGDGNIRYYEWQSEDNTLFYLNQYQSSESLRGVAMLPKRALNVNECEVARLYKVHPTMVEPISFKVPRKVVSINSSLINSNQICFLILLLGSHQ